MLTFSPRGIFLFIFSLLLFNIGLILNGVDKDIVTIFSIGISVLLGPYFITGKIFEGEEEINE